MCVAAAIAGGAVVGGVASSAIGGSAAKDAANTQADASRDAAAVQQQMYDTTRSDLAPYRDLGYNTIPWLQNALQDYRLTANFTAPTAEEAQATPGYKFTLDQGLKAAQNSASAKGLGASGAAIKGAESFATGLADSTYNDTFNRALSTFTTNQNTASQNVNRLLGIVGNGQNASAQTGALGAQTANGVANTITSGAAAQAAGTVGAANALTGGISSAVNGGTNALLLNSLLNNPSAPANSTSTLYGQSIGSNPYGFKVS